MGKKSGGGGATTQTQQTDIPPSLRPFLTEPGGLLPAARDWFQSGRFPQFPPFSTVPGQSPETLLSQNLQSGRAMMGSPLLPAAQSSLLGTVSGQNLFSNPSMPFLGGTLGGAFLGSNPFLDDMFNAAASGVTSQFRESIAPGLASGLGLAGRMSRGGDPNAVTESVFGRARGQLGDTLNRLAAGIYGPAYAQERGLQAQAAQDLSRAYGVERGFQESAIGMAPGLAAQDYFDIGQLGQVGAQREARSAMELQDQIARFQQQDPAAREMQRLQFYDQLIQGMPLGGFGQSFQPPGSGGSRAMGALGGAMTGASFLPMLSRGAGMFSAPVFEGGALLSAGGMNPMMWPLLLGGALLGGLR